MAVRIDATGEGLNRTSGLPSATTFTVAGWIYIVTNSANNWETVVSFQQDDNNYYTLYCRDNGSRRFQIYSGANNAQVGNCSLSTWYYCGMRRSGGAVGGFFAPVGATSLTQATAASSSNDPAELALGNNTVWDEWASARFANWIVWDGIQLTDDQLLYQMRHRRPVIALANLYSWSPLIEPGQIGDFSGGAHGFSSMGGTLTYEDGPPMIGQRPLALPYVSAGGLVTFDPVGLAASSTPAIDLAVQRAFIAAGLAASATPDTVDLTVLGGGMPPKPFIVRRSVPPNLFDI